MRNIIDLDKSLFRLINQRWHNDFFDWLLPVVRHANYSVPLYVFLLLFVIVNFKKKAWPWVLFAALLPAVTDLISSKLLKGTFPRLRPCNDPEMADGLRFLLSYRPQSSSFPSSHAVTHFAMAVFFYFTLKNIIGRWALLFFLWAFIIIYAQVYVGVHFPIDVICGAFTGSIIGYILSYIFNKKFLLA